MAIRLTSYCILINGVWNKISTQTTEIGRKGRDSHSCRPEISTQIAKMCKKGRDSQVPAGPPAYQPANPPAHQCRSWPRNLYPNGE